MHEKKLDCLVICIFLAYLRIQGRGGVTQSETEEKADVTHSCCIAVASLKTDFFVHFWSINTAVLPLLAVVYRAALRCLMPAFGSLWWCSNENRFSPWNPSWAPPVNLIIMERKYNVAFMLKCFTESPPGLLIPPLNDHDRSFVSTFSYIWQNTPSISLVRSWS